MLGSPEPTLRSPEQINGLAPGADDVVAPSLPLCRRSPCCGRPEPVLGSPGRSPEPMVWPSGLILGSAGPGRHSAAHDGVAGAHGVVARSLSWGRRGQ